MTSFAPLQSSPKELKEVCDPILRSLFDHCWIILSIVLLDLSAVKCFSKL